LLSGEDEARASSIGVIATHPGAKGLVADLGGGSLELARIGQDRVHQCTSFQLGVMRVAAIRARGRGQLRADLKERLRGLDWAQMQTGETLYLVGGAWRALGRFDAYLSGRSFAQPIPADAARALKITVREFGPRRLAALPKISSARAAQLGDASALLAALIAETGAPQVQVSTTGLREGLLAAQLGQLST
jgi:exopolyphosphatase/guanosine-5'-triphosphate,3'-diphosphate pyrophosphatase